jgi:hypothetical protein
MSCSVRFPASSKQRRSTADQRWGIHCIQLGVWYTSISTLRRLIKDSTTRYSREITQQAPSEAYISLSNLLRISKLWLSIIVTYNNHSSIRAGTRTKDRYSDGMSFPQKTTSGHGTRKQQSRARDYNRRNTPKPLLNLCWKEGVPGSGVGAAVEYCRDGDCHRRKECMA